MSFSDTPPPPPPGFETGGGQRALATWDRRVLASLIDGALIFAGYIIVLVVVAIVSQISGTLATLVGLLGYLAVFGFGLWQLVVQGQTGQTIGKRQIGIKLVREQDGQVLGAGMSIVRAIVHVVDSVPCLIGYLWPLWDEKRQTFADKILQTVVIDAK